MLLYLGGQKWHYYVPRETRIQWFTIQWHVHVSHTRIMAAYPKRKVSKNLFSSPLSYAKISLPNNIPRCIHWKKTCISISSSHSPLQVLSVIWFFFVLFNHLILFLICALSVSRISAVHSWWFPFHLLSFSNKFSFKELNERGGVTVTP